MKSTCKENEKIFTCYDAHVKKTAKSLHVTKKAKIGKQNKQNNRHTKKR